MADAAGATILVFHSQFAAFVKEEKVLPDWIAGSVAYWSGWRDHLDASDLRVMIENIFETGPEPILGLLDGLDTDRIRACLDVGHAHLFSGDVPAWVKVLGTRIGYVHLHDNDGDSDQHKLLFSGTVDWPRLAKTLARSSYTKCISSESNMRSKEYDNEAASLKRAFELGSRFSKMVAEQKGLAG